MPRKHFSDEIARIFRAVEIPSPAEARVSAMVRHDASQASSPQDGRSRLRRILVPTAAIAALAAGLAVGVIVWRSGDGGGNPESAVSNAASGGSHASGSAGIPSGDQGDLISVSAARSKAGFEILMPGSLPNGYQSSGVWVPLDASQVRVHFAGPAGDIVLLEEPSTDGSREPNGLEFPTSVNGYPALGVKGDVPPDPTGPVSQLQWWTGSMYFDLYGPVPYEEIEQTAASVPQTSD
jgi:hypothetical protein